MEGSEQAQDKLRQLDAIIHQLPVGVTVEAEDGRTLLVNALASARSGVQAQAFGASPAPEPQQPPSAAGADPPAAAANEIIRLETGHTMLVSRQPARVDGETVMLSTSVDITERARIESELVRRAYYDELTGLPNRSLIRQRVDDTLARDPAGGRFALAFIDVDNFKHINDFYSHAIGDEMLVKFARRITDQLRPTDMLARISGDEFVLVLDPVEVPDQLQTIVGRLLHQLAQPFHIDGFEIFTSASIGVSVHPDHGSDYEGLRRSADSAMYRAKREFKGGAAFFDLDMGRAISARMELEQRLRLAIRDRKFCCAFQPKVDIRSRDVIGVEALVRWRDGFEEIPGPTEFIALAVELGLIDQVTHLVLDEAAASIGRIEQAFGSATTISINVAAKQASNLDFMHSLAAGLRATGRADRFIIEVTEDAYVPRSRFQTEVLPILRNIGVRVSIDDFGTGYSSLSALADITADEIKVDRSFITGIHERPRSQSVLKAIESLAGALGMVVVAEGVETAEELAYLLAATRIRYAQGFYFAKPFFLEDVGDFQRVSAESRPAPVAREVLALRGARGRG